VNQRTGWVLSDLDRNEIFPEIDADLYFRAPVRPMSERREDVLHGSRKE
jgi:hypothetical protein